MTPSPSIFYHLFSSFSHSLSATYICYLYFPLLSSLYALFLICCISIFFSPKCWRWSKCNRFICSLYFYGVLLSSFLLFSILVLLICFPFDYFSTCSFSYSISWRLSPYHPNKSHSSVGSRPKLFGAESSFCKR